MAIEMQNDGMRMSKTLSQFQWPVFSFVHCNHDIFSLYSKRVGIEHKVQVGMCVEKIKIILLICQFDQRFSLPSEDTLDPWLTKERPSNTLIRLHKCAVLHASW